MGVNSCGTTLIDNGTFKNIGAITWDTTAKTGNFTAVSGNGYFVNTTSASITVTLPSSPSAGDVVGIADYANTADTNKIVIGRNGSNIQGAAADFDIVKEGGTIVLVYVDATQGWLSIDAAEASAIVSPQFTVATGGTITTSGDYKIHTFTSPGTFCVSAVGNSPIFPTAGPGNVDYLVVAGGGAGASNLGGGAGGGGHRTTFPSPGCNAGSFPISVTAFPITVGAGGAATCQGPNTGANRGSNSVFSSITSTGGGGGAGSASPGCQGVFPTMPGGSGGGGSNGAPGPAGGSGNTPPVSPPQGNNGGSGGGPSPNGAGGGGGAGATGTPYNPGGCGSGNGGNGLANSINGSSVTRAGGGGGGGFRSPGPNGSGGSGGGGAGGNPGPSPSSGGTAGVSGTVNTGGGGGGGSGSGPNLGGSGGSGIVIIRYKYQ